MIAQLEHAQYAVEDEIANDSANDNANTSRGNNAESGACASGNDDTGKLSQPRLGAPAPASPPLTCHPSADD